MCLAIRPVVAPHNVAFCVDSVAFAETCTRHRDIYGDELPLAEDKPVLVSILAEIEANDVSFRVHARDPSERGVRKVDRAELSINQPKAVEHGVAVEVAANDARSVERHCWKRAYRAGNINESECAPAENVPMPMKKIWADELHTYHITGIADAKAREIGARKVDGLEGALA